MQKPVAALVLVAAAALAAGCGGGGSSSATGTGTTTTSAKALSAADYRAAASDLCKRWRKDVSGIKTDTAESIAQNGDRAADIQEQAVNEIANLEAPDELSGAADALVSNERDLITTLRGLVSAVKSGDSQRVSELEAGAVPTVHAIQQAAQDLGVPACAG